MTYWVKECSAFIILFFASPRGSIECKEDEEGLLPFRLFFESAQRVIVTREKEEEIFLSLSKSPIFEEENGARGEKERVPTAFSICPPLSIPSNAHTSGRKNGTSNGTYGVFVLTLLRNILDRRLRSSKQTSFRDLQLCKRGRFIPGSIFALLEK